MSKPVTNYFLPYLKLGFASQFSENKMGAKRTTFPVTLKVGTEQIQKEATIDVALYGPGDIIGFNRSAILKTEPQPNIADFDAALVPFIEFRDPDFLWRYSSHKSYYNRFWHPWVTLIVLKNNRGNIDAAEFSYLNNEQKDLPAKIQLNASAVLPDLKEGWRWAHVHMVDQKGLSASHVKQVVAKNRHRAVGRLLAPRQLEEDTHYTAFVVPTYRIGIEAAFGINTIQSPTLRTTYAWNEDTQIDGFELPYYYSWSFQTGTRGDFEFYIRELSFKKIKSAGLRTIDGQNPGYGLLDSDNRTIQIEGALKSADIAFQNWGFDGEEDGKGTQQKLSELLNKREITEEGKTTLRVTPPVYGEWYFRGQDGNRIELDAQQTNWLNEVNLDFRHRYAAGLGVEFVKKNQEKLMKSAWQQLAQIKEVNQTLNLGKFGRAISNCLYKKLIDLQSVKLVQMGVSIVSPIINKNQEPPFDPGDDLDPLIDGFDAVGITISTVGEQLKNEKQLTVTNQTKFKKYLSSKFLGLGSTSGLGSVRNNYKSYQSHEIVHPVMSLDGLATHKTDLELQSFIELKDATNDMNWLGENIRDAIDPRRTIEKPLCSKIDAFRVWENQEKPTFYEDDLDDDLLEDEYEADDLPDDEYEGDDPLKMLMWYPEFHYPLFRFLIEKSLQTILPGIEQVPPDTVSLLTTNNRFVEAMLLGANHEFSSELRWHSFPTNMRGTYFRSFWEKTIYSVTPAQREAFRSQLPAKRLIEKIIVSYPEYPVTLGNQPTLLFIEQLFEKPTTEINERDIEVMELYENAIEKWLLTRAEGKDIPPISFWNKSVRLGLNAISPNASGKDNNQVVLLIRSELLRKFPSVVIYLAPFSVESSKKPNFDKRIFPVFEGNFPSDMVFLGFPIIAEQLKNYFLVFEEPMSDIRFGLDVRNEANPIDTNDGESDLSWQHFKKLKKGAYLDGIKPMNTESKSQWNDPAYVGKVFTQKSVRVAVPLKRFL